ncbi:unnamed protein product [Urochloa humidicola]
MLWMRLLRCWTLKMKHIVEERGLSVGFLDPMLFSFTGIQYQTKALECAIKKEMEHDFVVGAYNTGGHWILVIIAMQWNIVWAFGTHMDEQLKGLKPKPKAKPKLRHKPQYPCAQQPFGSQACGFYVALQLFDFVHDCNKMKKSADYKPTKEVDKTGLMMVQGMLAEFIVDKVINPKGKFHQRKEDGSADAM